MKNYRYLLVCINLFFVSNYWGQCVNDVNTNYNCVPTNNALPSNPNTDADFAFIAYGTNQNTRNFLVTGGGEVFARRYTTTLQNIPDYVFAPTYNLMPLNELRTYLNTNRHLPNIPSATEMEAQPVDLGELTRLLLEKIEESTLYILQLEERVKALENGN